MGISVEVVDAALGRPAAGISVTLAREADTRWYERMSTHTNEVGRVEALDPDFRRGRYQLTLDLDQYFAGFGVTPFQSRVQVILRVFHPDDQVRLLLMVTSSSCSMHLVLPGGHDDPSQDGTSESQRT